MRYPLALLVIGVGLGACSTLPLPGVGSGMPQTCAERLTESQCREGPRCRWINDTRRPDGTYATAHCETE
jgi:hypothetical protein